MAGMSPSGFMTLGAPGASEQIGGILQSIAGNGNLTNQLLGKLIETLSTILPFSGATGTFTMAAAASTTVNDTNVKTNSIIIPFPTNAAAGTLVGSVESPYIAPGSYVVGTSFAVACASGAASGTETFAYILVNPTG